MTRKCSKCKQDQPISHFYPDNRKPGRLLPRCKECYRLSGKAWIGRNPGINQRYHRKYIYGLSTEEYLDMKIEQNGLCAICGILMSNPTVDHCHVTKKVRGILCGQCNCAIGMLRSDPSICRSAADYLDKHSGVKIQEFTTPRIPTIMEVMERRRRRQEG